MNVDIALEILNNMIIKEHHLNKILKKTYTKEELMMFCKKLLLEIKNV